MVKVAALVVACAAAAPAWGAPEHLRDESACVSALKHAKDQEQTGSLLDAKDLYLSCAHSPCAEFVRRQCSARHAKLEADTPTVVFVVTDSSGATRTDAQVRVDGTLLEGPLDGHPVEVDPGFHDFSFIVHGHVFATQKVMIVQGQRNRFVTTSVGATAGREAPIDQSSALAEAPVPPAQALRSPISTTPVRAARRPSSKKPVAAATDDNPTSTATSSTTTTPALVAADAATPEPDETPAPPPAHTSKRALIPWILGAVGVASLGTAAVLTTWGRKDNDQLAICAPGCNDSDLRHIRRLYVGADVAIGVGVAALGAAYWVYARGRGTAAEAPPQAETALRLDLAPTRAGGVASISGRF
jgi:hypothetical protein